MVNAWEWSYNGVTINVASGDIGINSVEGLDAPGIRTDITDRVAEHGAYVFADWFEPRHIVMNGDIASSSEANFITARDSLKGMFVPQRSELPLVFKLFSTGLQYRFNARPTRFNLMVDRDYGRFNPNWVGEFVAEDPRMYADTATTGTINLNTSPGNITPTPNNAGVIRTPWTLVFTGPGTDFKILDVDTTLFIRVNASLTAGQTMTIDRWNRTIVRSDGASMYGSLTTDSQWFELAPGSHVLTASVASGRTSATKADLTFRSAWN